MPIYEYQCQACGHRFDQLQKVSDPHPDSCPSCGKSALQRLISPTGFQLKGTGWYVTDFKNSDKPKPTKPSADATTDKTATAAEKTTPAATEPAKQKNQD